MTPVKPRYALLAAASLALLTSCGSGTNDSKNADSTAAVDNAVKPTPGETGNGDDLKPAGPKPSWAPDMDDAMAVVIEKLGSMGGKPIETLTAEEARRQPTPTDAVMAVMKEHNMPVPTPTSDTTGKDIGNGVHVRIYTPKGANGPLPVILYIHGGGWVIADNNVYDASARGICEGVGAAVVSVEYRKGPEHKFPTAHNDAFAAYQWVLANAASFKGDPKRVALLGESAGGNMACNVSIMARDKGIQMPLYQVLVYPVAQDNMNTESYTKYAMAKPLNKAMMSWFGRMYLANPAQMADPRMSLVKANLKGLPATTIINAEIDPLADDGKMLADKLQEAGVSVDRKVYDGVVHEFFGMAAVVPDAKDAQKYASGKLKDALKK